MSSAKRNLDSAETLPKAKARKHSATKSKPIRPEDLKCLLALAGSSNLATARLAATKAATDLKTGIVAFIKSHQKFEEESAACEVGLLRTAMELISVLNDVEYTQVVAARISSNSDEGQFADILNYAVKWSISTELIFRIARAISADQMVDFFANLFGNQQRANSHGDKCRALLAALSLRPTEEYCGVINILLDAATDRELEMLATAFNSVEHRKPAASWAEQVGNLLEQGAATVGQVRLLSRLWPLGAEFVLRAFGSTNEQSSIPAEAILTFVRGPGQIEIVQQILHPRLLENYSFLYPKNPATRQLEQHSVDRVLENFLLLQASCAGYGDGTAFTQVFPGGALEPPSFEVRQYFLDNLLDFVWFIALAILPRLSPEEYRILLMRLGSIFSIVSPAECLRRGIIIVSDDSLGDRGREFFFDVFMQVLHVLINLSKVEERSRMFGGLMEFTEGLVDKMKVGGVPMVDAAVSHAKDQQKRLEAATKKITENIRSLLTHFAPDIEEVMRHDRVRDSGGLVIPDNRRSIFCDYIATFGPNASAMLKGFVLSFLSGDEEKRAQALCVIRQIAADNEEVAKLVNALVANAEDVVVPTVTVAFQEIAFAGRTTDAIWNEAVKGLFMSPSTATTEAKSAIYKRVLSDPGKHQELATMLIHTGL